MVVRVMEGRLRRTLCGASDSMLGDPLVLVMRVRCKVLNSAASGWRVYFPKICSYIVVSFALRT